MHKVLVLDADQRSALAIIRSLGRHDLEVIAGDRRAHPLGAASKHAAGSVRYPDPATCPQAFVGEITAITERQGIDTIVPATDLTTMLLVSQPNASISARLVAPEAESYEMLTDKARLAKLAQKLGIALPVTQIANSAAAVADAAREIGFPIVLKPARSRYLRGQGVRSTRVELASSPEVLSQILASQNWLDDIPCLVQRFVPGHGAGIFALYDSSKPIAWFAHRRILEKPPTGGVSVLCESAPVEAVMQSAAAKLLSAAKWSGVAMVEFRVAHDGTPYLMEVNGRFWGSLQLAIDCGIDFPWLAYCVTQNLPVPEPQPYSVGKRLRWLLGDADSLLITVRGTHTQSGAKRKALAAFMRSFADPACRQEIMRISDPWPGLREAAHWLKASLAACRTEVRFERENG